MTGWDGKFDLQLLFQCGSKYSCLSSSVPEIHCHVAGTFTNQPTTTVTWPAYRNVNDEESFLSIGHRLVGLVVRRPPQERKIPGSNPACAGICRGRVIPVTQKLALQWLPCQAPGVIGSTLGLVGPVSIYCDWVRWKVWSATSISVWQHVLLSEQIRPWDTLACCWDVKQATNKQTFLSIGLRLIYIFCKFEMPFPCIRSVEKGSYHDQDFPVIGRNELTFSVMYTIQTVARNGLTLSVMYTTQTVARNGLTLSVMYTTQTVARNGLTLSVMYTTQTVAPNRKIHAASITLIWDILKEVRVFLSYYVC